MSDTTERVCKRCFKAYEGSEDASLCPICRDTTDKPSKCACGGNLSIDTPHDAAPTCLCRKCGQFWSEDAWAGLERLREAKRLGDECVNKAWQRLNSTDAEVVPIYLSEIEDEIDAYRAHCETIAKGD